MEDKYYIVPESKYLKMLEKHGDSDDINENQDVVNGINELTKGCKLIDLSDEAIVEEAKYYSKGECNSYYGYLDALMLLKEPKDLK